MDTNLKLRFPKSHEKNAISKFTLTLKIGNKVRDWEELEFKFSCLCFCVTFSELFLDKNLT